MKIQIRKSIPADAEQIAKIHVLSWQESYQGIMPDDYLANIAYDERLKLRQNLLQNQNKSALHLVAICNDRIIGFCDVGVNQDSKDIRGELYAIYLLNEFKHQGIGSNLIELVKKHCEKEQLLPLIVWVLKDNASACKFYEKHGGKYHQEGIIEIGGNKYSEISYIFDK